MANPHDEAYDQETITLLADVLERAWAALPADRQSTTTRAHIAEYILTLAAHGERSTSKLYDSVLAHFTQHQK